jgi:hypothetical protein
MTVDGNLPKRKPNHFYFYNKNMKKYEDVKYISQNDLAEGYKQVIPSYSNKKLINHFSITLCYLPDYLWKYLKKEGETYKIIKDGLTRYSIVETNQDELMVNLFNEIKKSNPNVEKLSLLVNEIDESQHNSWLILRAKYYVKRGHFPKSSPISSIDNIELDLSNYM